jgi:hypothetical protein
VLSGGLADPGLAFELVPVIDRACRLAHGLLVPTARGGTSILCTSILAVASLSVFAGEAGTVVAPNT